MPVPRFVKLTVRVAAVITREKVAVDVLDVEIDFPLKHAVISNIGKGGMAGR